jgi:hypothetical protein
MPDSHTASAVTVRLVYLARLLGYGAPHLRKETAAALATAREHLASIKLDGVAWYWPDDESPRSGPAVTSPAKLCQTASARSRLN